MIERIELKWGDRSGSIAPDQAFAAAAVIEDHTTVFELQSMMQDVRSMRPTRIAPAYAALLRFSGIPATQEEVWTHLSSALKTKAGAPALAEYAKVVNMMMIILMDGAPAQDAPSEEPAGNSEAPTS